MRAHTYNTLIDIELNLIKSRYGGLGLEYRRWTMNDRRSLLVQRRNCLPQCTFDTWLEINSTCDVTLVLIAFITDKRNYE